MSGKGIFNKRVQLVLRIVVGGVFIWAGLLKVLDPLGFAQNITAYRVFPRSVSFFLALTLPAIEVACGLLLLAGFFRKAAALLASVFCVSFIVLVAATMIRGLDISCGCFGSLSGKADLRLLVQDVILLALSLAVLLSKSDPLSLDAVRSSP